MTSVQPKTRRPSLRLGDLTLRKWHYQTGLPSLVNCEPCQLLPAQPVTVTVTINRDKASNHDKMLRVILK
jgi:hypothetical protein